MTAKKLANYFKVDIIFTHSKGNNSYVEQELESRTFANIINQNSVGVKCQKKSKKIHIYTQWRWSNTWNFLKMLFEKAGFLLFIIIMSGFMIKLGGLLDNIISVIRGKDDIIYLSSPLVWSVSYTHLTLPTKA